MSDNNLIILENLINIFDFSHHFLMDCIGCSGGVICIEKEIGCDIVFDVKHSIKHGFYGITLISDRFYLSESEVIELDKFDKDFLKEIIIDKLNEK